MHPSYAFLTKASFAVIVLLQAIAAAATPLDSEFRMPIADVFKIAGVGVVLSGQVASGAASVGDWVCVPMQDGQLLGRKIVGLETFRSVLEKIEVGQQASITLEQLEHSQIDKDTDLVAGCAEDTPIPEEKTTR